ncbi:MAG: LPS assembly protein LptD [Rickettsiales bacterium]|jgi:LPS-assembly protein|nr:LPS assembly protein LptD [Rickettsiales bacterium]
MKKTLLNIFFLLYPCALVAEAVDIQAAKTISAPKIEYNVKSAAIQTKGRTEISNTANQKIIANDLYLNNKATDAAGQNIELWLGKNIHVSADKVVRKNENTVSKNAVFTACYGCDEYGNAWEISASKISHNMESHMMKFYNPVMWAYGLPVFWVPFFAIPDPSVKRKSGILIPDINSTNNMGTQFNLPVYIALSDTHDMTLKLSYLTKENPLFQLEHRLNQKHSEFRTSGSFTHNKAGENRWHIFNDDVIELGENAKATIYLERASDKTYLQKYGFYGDQPYLDSGVKAELFGQSGYVVADAHIFQELRGNSNHFSIPSGNILPNIRGNYQTSPLFGETYAILNADILGISGESSISQRIIGESGIISPWTLWGGQRMTASASARYDIYNFDNTVMIDGNGFSGLKTRFLPSGYLEWGLPLARAGQKWTHVIEPRARLTAMLGTSEPAFALNNDSAGTLLSDATLFSKNRFSGLDLWENGTFADYGMRWAAFDGSGHNLEIFAGQSYDFTERPDTDPNSGFHNGRSDYVGRVEYKNSKWLELAGRFRLAEDNFSLRHLETAAAIGGQRNYFNISHIWARQFIDVVTLGDNIHEFSAGLGLGITQRVEIKFNAVYNMTETRFQRHTGGIFYNHPCYFMSLEYRRDNAKKDDYVGNTTFQFRFGLNLNEMK